MGESDLLISKFVTYIVDPALALIFAAGFFVFVWGLVQFLWKLEDGHDRSEGIKHMIWGVAGMVIMVSVQGILMLIDNTFQLDPLNPDMSRINDSFPR